MKHTKRRDKKLKLSKETVRTLVPLDENELAQAQGGALKTRYCMPMSL